MLSLATGAMAMTNGVMRASNKLRRCDMLARTPLDVTMTTVGISLVLGSTEVDDVRE